jgi:hypothetical protein
LIEISNFVLNLRINIIYFFGLISRELHQISNFVIFYKTIYNKIKSTFKRILFTLPKFRFSTKAYAHGFHMQRVLLMRQDLISYRYKDIKVSKYVTSELYVIIGLTNVSKRLLATFTGKLFNEVV